MPLASLLSRYVVQSQKLQGYGAASALAGQEQGQRPWMVPDLNTAASPPGVQSIAGLAPAFDRSALAALYGQVLTSAQGSAGDAMALKLQSDYLAGQERAYRLRQASPVRAALHAAARRAGHGVVGAGVFGRVDGYIQDLIVAGGAGFRPNGG